MEDIFGEARRGLVGGAEMSDLRVALEWARHTLGMLDGTRLCSQSDRCPRLHAIWENDNGKEIRLLDAAIEKLASLEEAEQREEEEEEPVGRELEMYEELRESMFRFCKWALDPEVGTKARNEQLTILPAVLEILINNLL